VLLAAPVGQQLQRAARRRRRLVQLADLALRARQACCIAKWSSGGK
jgi:hypothetical protein